MALSDNEQRLFEELERELRGDAKPQFAAGRASRLALGGLILVVGLAAVIAGVATQLISWELLGSPQCFLQPCLPPALRPRQLANQSQ